jgi:hypothetical protein
MKEILEKLIRELELCCPTTDTEIDWVKDELRRYRKLLEIVERKK